MTFALQRTGVLVSAEALTMIAGALVTPRQVKIETPNEVYFRERKSRSPRWRLYLKQEDGDQKL